VVAEITKFLFFISNPE